MTILVVEFLGLKGSLVVQAEICSVEGFRNRLPQYHWKNQLFAAQGTLGTSVVGSWENSCCVVLRFLLQDLQQKVRRSGGLRFLLPIHAQVRDRSRFQQAPRRRLVQFRSKLSGSTNPRGRESLASQRMGYPLQSVLLDSVHNTLIDNSLCRPAI